MAKIHILGIGNILMGDEGAGVFTVRYLQEQYVFPDVEIMDGGTGGFHLLSFMQDTEHLILVDAAVDGKPPGTITELHPRYSSEYPPTIVAHDIGLKDLLDAMYVMEKQPELTLFTLSINQPAGINTEPGKEIMQAIPKLAQEIANKVKSL